eukprot:468921-Pyramimonas_sp.AAC.2
MGTAHISHVHYSACSRSERERCDLALCIDCLPTPCYANQPMAGASATALRSGPRRTEPNYQGEDGINTT